MKSAPIHSRNHWELVLVGFGNRDQCFLILCQSIGGRRMIGSRRSRGRRSDRARLGRSLQSEQRCQRVAKDDRDEMDGNEVFVEARWRLVARDGNCLLNQFRSVGFRKTADRVRKATFDERDCIREVIVRQLLQDVAEKLLSVLATRKPNVLRSSIC